MAWCLARDVVNNVSTMLKNYLKITFRNILRNKLFAAINILGLSVSLACCLLLFLHTSQQLGYDKHHKQRVVRISSHITQPDGQELLLSSSSVPIAPALKASLPEIKNSMRFFMPSDLGSKDLMSYEEEAFYVKGGIVADTSFFDVLTYDLVAGNVKQPFPFINAIVLEKETAALLFGETNAIGKVIKLSSIASVDEFEVTAIYDADTYSTHLSPPYIISTEHTSWKPFLDRFTGNWISNNLVYSYFSLRDDANIREIEKKLDAMALDRGGEEMKSLGLTKKMTMLPVGDIHTSDGFLMDSFSGKSLLYIRILMGVGILILVLACINYINLATAQAGNRAMEVGIRKSLGVTSRGLITQFLGESFFIVFISLLISILFAEMALPVFNHLVNDPISISAENVWTIAKYMLMFLVSAGVLAGLYPAIYLSSFKPAVVLKGKNKDKGVATVLRKGLVVFQFVISIALISAILVISNQVDYIRNKDLGFDKASKLIVPLLTDEAGTKYKLLSEAFSDNPEVKSVSGSRAIPGNTLISDLLLHRSDQTIEEGMRVLNNVVEYNYPQLLGLKLLAGRYFDGPEKDTVVSKIILNRTAVERLGYTPDESIGEELQFDFNGLKFRYRVIGVIEDFHQLSLHSSIDPMMFELSTGDYQQNIILDIEAGNFQQALHSLKRDWSDILPDLPFEYFLLDDHLNIQYASDTNTFNLIKYFAVISVVISCLGLYALSMFFAERRFKEIGVRKVMGADVKDILFMVSGDLSKLILIAFAISVPLAVYTTNLWLDTFAYRISPGVEVFLSAGAVSLLIGWVTISYQSLKAAMTNPVNVLRNE